MLTADKAALQQQAGRLEGLERELHQAKWQITSLEQQLQNSTTDANYRVAQAQAQAQQAHAQIQQVQAQAQAQVQQVQAQAQAQAQQAHVQIQQAQAQQQSRTLSMPMPMNTLPPPLPMPTYTPAYVPPPPPVRSSNPQPQYNGYQPPAPLYNSSYNSASAAPSLSSLAASTGFNPSGYNNLSTTGSSGSTANHHKRAASAGPTPVVDSTASAPFGTASKSPFANDVTSAQINHVFDDLDRRLTSMMAEKTALQDESER